MEKVLQVLIILQITMIMATRKLKFLSIWTMVKRMDYPQSLRFLLSRRVHNKEFKKWALEMYQLHRIAITSMQVYTIIKLVNNPIKKNSKNSNMQRAIMIVINTIINKKEKEEVEDLKIEINFRECIRNVIMMSFVNPNHHRANNHMMNCPRNLVSLNEDSENYVNLRMLNRNLINASINAGQAKINSKVTS